MIKDQLIQKVPDLPDHLPSWIRLPSLTLDVLPQYFQDEMSYLGRPHHIERPAEMSCGSVQHPLTEGKHQQNITKLTQAANNDAGLPKHITKPMLVTQQIPNSQEMDHYIGYNITQSEKLPPFYNFPLEAKEEQGQGIDQRHHQPVAGFHNQNNMHRQVPAHFQPSTCGPQQMPGYIQQISSANGHQTEVKSMQRSFPVNIQKKSEPYAFKQFPADMQHTYFAGLEKVPTVIPQQLHHDNHLSAVEPSYQFIANKSVLPKLCRKCKQEGHYRIECPNQAFCTICSEHGHQNRSHQKRLKRLKQCEANSVCENKESSFLQPQAQKSVTDIKTTVDHQFNHKQGSKDGSLIKCFNCGGANHKSTHCTNSPFCGICKQSGHTNKQHRSQLAKNSITDCH